MAPLRSIILLGLLSSTGLAAAVNRRDTCQAGVQTIDGQEFTVQCDVDRAGNNEDNGIQTSLSGCAEACASDSNCVTAEYSLNNGFCYRKNSQNQLSLVSGTVTYDKGDGCTDNLQVEGCNVQCNMDSPGNNIDAGQYVGSYAACAALCASNSQCATAQYRTTNGFCYQKTEVNGQGFSPAAYTVSLVCPNNGYQSS